MIKYLKKSILYLSTLVLFLTTSSCDAIYDYEGDCDQHYYVKFVYDMNMLYSDAFSSKVKSVDLYVFDAKTGDLVKKYSEAGDALSREGYMIELDLNPGEYELIAWCGLDNNKGHFTVKSSISKIIHAECMMARNKEIEGVAIQNENLNALYHGRVNANLPSRPGTYYYTVRLTKDTNNINISMQHLSGELDPDNFVIEMKDSNGYMAHDNSLKEDEEITYSPWTLRAGSAETGSNQTGFTNFIQAELSTSRMTVDHNPVITITDKTTGNTIFSIPITKWALQLRSENYAQMDEQEYLDREDEFNVMLYLDNNDEQGWYAASILINGWHIMESNTTITNQN